MSRYIVLGCGIVLSAIFAVASANGQQPVLLTSAQQDAIPAAARRTIAEANASWLEAMKRQDTAAISAPYADEAVFVTPDGQSLRGRAALEAFERGRFEKTGRVLDGSIEDDGMAMTGPYIYEWGHATLRVAGRGGESNTVAGRFVTVWTRDSQGRWRIIRNVSLAN